MKKSNREQSGAERNRSSARERAVRLRQQQHRREVRTKWIVRSAVAVTIAAVIAGIAVVIVSAQRPAGSGPKNMANDGIRIGQGLSAAEAPARPADAPVTPNPAATPGVPTITIYSDYMCPGCGIFETTNRDQLQRWVDTGAATVEYHPLAILDRFSLGSKYSSRSTNAAACVANYSPNSFFSFNALLFANQPEENTDGLSNDTLKGLVRQSGPTDAAAIEQCVDTDEFGRWATLATGRAVAKSQGSVPPIQGTPTIFVNDRQYSGPLTDAAQFAEFVSSVG